MANATPSATSHFLRSAVPNPIDAEVSSTNQVVSDFSAMSTLT
jgi:hypothetical protein